MTGMSSIEVFNFVMGNAAFTLNALSFWMKDLTRLRWTAVAASVCFTVYSATVAGGPLWLMIAWSIVFLSINLYRLLKPYFRSTQEPQSVSSDVAIQQES